MSLKFSFISDNSFSVQAKLDSVAALVTVKRGARLGNTGIPMESVEIVGRFSA